MLLTGMTSSSLRVPELRAVSWSSSDDARFSASMTLPCSARPCPPLPCSSARRPWTRPTSGAAPSITPRRSPSDLFTSMGDCLLHTLSGVLEFESSKMRRFARAGSQPLMRGGAGGGSAVTSAHSRRGEKIFNIWTMSLLGPLPGDQGCRSCAPVFRHAPLLGGWLAIALILAALDDAWARESNKAGSLAGSLRIRGGLASAELARVEAAGQVLHVRGCMAPPTAIRGGGGERGTFFGRVKAWMMGSVGGMSMIGGCFGVRIGGTEAEIESAWKSFAGGREGGRTKNESSWKHSVRSGTPRSYRLPTSLSLEEGLEQVRSSPQPDEPVLNSLASPFTTCSAPLFSPSLPCNSHPPINRAGCVHAQGPHLTYRLG